MQRYLRIVISSLILALAVPAVVPHGSQVEAASRWQRVKDRWENSRFNLAKRWKDWRTGRKKDKAKSKKGKNGKGSTKSQVRKIVDDTVSDMQKARFHFRGKSRNDARAAAEKKMREKLAEIVDSGEKWAEVKSELQNKRVFRNGAYGAVVGAVPKSLRDTVMNNPEALLTQELETQPLASTGLETTQPQPQPEPQKEPAGGGPPGNGNNRPINEPEKVTATSPAKE